MNKRTLLKALPLVATFIAGQSLAHHSVTAHFDMGKTIEIRGTVVDFKLRSPHSSMIVDGVSYVDGVLQDEEVGRWEVESSAASGLLRMGINADTFNPGDSIVVMAAPNRQPGFRFVNSTNFTAGDDTTFNRGTSTPYASVSDESIEDLVGIEKIAGRWSVPGAFALQASPLPLNAAGLAAWENYDPKLSAANTCESMSFPGIFNAPYLFDVSIEGNEVTLYNQPWEVSRKATLDGEPIVTEPAGLFGVISASIDGNSIVIESRDYPVSLWGLGAATQKNGSGSDLPSSNQKTVTERYSVSEDGQTLIYEYTVTDPVYLTQPHSDRLEFSRIASDTPMYGYECELESASMFSRTPTDQQLEVGQ